MFVICCKSVIFCYSNFITISNPIIFTINSLEIIRMFNIISIFIRIGISFTIRYFTITPTIAIPITFSFCIISSIWVKSNSNILSWFCICTCCCCKCRIWQCTKHTKCCYSTAYYKCCYTTANTISRRSTLFSVTMGKFRYNDILIFYLAPYYFINLIHKFTLPFK